MSKQLYTPGDPVAVIDLEVGDTIFARHDRATKTPTAPVQVVRLEPSVRDTGLIQVVVQSVYSRQSPWIMGWLGANRQFPRAVPVEA